MGSQKKGSHSFSERPVPASVAARRRVREFLGVGEQPRRLTWVLQHSPTLVRAATSAGAQARLCLRFSVRWPHRGFRCFCIMQNLAASLVAACIFCLFLHADHNLLTLPST
jgi:hypothetical protein